MESIHVNFDELPQIASDQNSSDPTPECQTMALNHDSLSPRRKCQENVSYADRTVTTSNELDLLFSLMFDELLNGSSKVVSKSSAVSAADTPNQQSNAEMCMFALTVSQTEPKNIKEAMVDSAWIESMQEELHQFDRLDVWELLDRPLCTNVINLKDGENLDKMKEKGDECIFVGSDPEPECQTMALNHDSLSPAIQCQANVSQADKIVKMSIELDLLFSPMFDELLNGHSQVVSKSFDVSAADAPNQRQQYTTSLNNHTTPAPTCQIPSIAPTIISSKNINQAETHAVNDQVADDEFINIFSTPVQDQGETSSRHVDWSNMHTFYQRFPSKHRWTKDHPLEQVIRNPSQSVRTRRQLESDAGMCMFVLTEELHQFDRLDIWELVDRPLCTNVINLKWLWKNKRDEENTGLMFGELSPLVPDVIKVVAS
nr:Gag-Pol polyprotein [Tanacetum cinerariifolium]